MFQAERRIQWTPAAMPQNQVKAPDLNTMDSSTWLPVWVQPVIQPVQSKADMNTIDSATGKPVSESQPIQPVISPVLQAKIDAKKNGTAPSLNPNQKSVEETLNDRNRTREQIIRAENPWIDNEWVKGLLGKMTPEDEKKVASTLTPYKTSEDIKNEQSQMLADKSKVGEQQQQVETSDIEKQAQATGVEYTMQNWQATYNPKTTEEATKILAMGGKLAGENKLTAVAQASLNKVRWLGQMTDQQLANNIAGGQVSNKELELLNTMNPGLVAQAKELSKKKVITNTTNEIQADNSAIIKGEEPTGMSRPLADLLKKLETIDADTKSPAEMKTAYQDAHPEMTQSRDQINTLTSQKRDLQMAKMKLYDETKAKLSGYPQSMIMAAYSAASRDLDDSIYLLNDDLNTEISNYNMYLDDMNAEIEFEIGQQGKAEERLWNVFGVTNAAQIRSEDIQREDQRLQQSIDLEEARYQRDIERDDIKSAQERKYKIEDMKLQQDYAIDTWLLGLWVDPTWMTSEEKRANYAQASQNALNKEDAYKTASLLREEKYTNEDGSEWTRWINPITGREVTPQETFWPEATDKTFEEVLSGYSTAGQELLLVPDGTVVPTRLWEVSPQNASVRGKECAEYVNDILGEKKLWSTYQSKVDVCTEPSGGIGSVVAWKPNGSGSYGHTGIKVWEDENFEYIKSSNYVPGTVTTEAIPKGTIKNYYTPESVKKVQEQAQAEPTAKKYANGNVRTTDGILYDKKEVSETNKTLLKDENFKALTVAQNLNQKLLDFEKSFQENGTEIWPLWVFNPKGKTDLQATYTNLLLTAKEFFNLWVLNWPDLDLIAADMPSPVTFELNGKTINGTPRNAKVEQGIETMRKLIQNKVRNDYKTVNDSYGNFWETLWALKTANSIYSQFATAEDDVNQYLNQK